MVLAFPALLNQGLSGRVTMRSPPYAAAGLCLLALSCSTLRQIRPLAKGESSAAISVGGPITKVGNSYIPLPLISIGYNYGLVEKLDVEAGINLLSALYGIAEIDAGVNWRPWIARGFIPGLIASPKLFLLTNFTPASLRVYPDVQIAGYWEPWKYKYVYCGIDNWIEHHQTRDDGSPQTNHWLPAPIVGISLGNRQWQAQCEAKWYVPNLINNTRAVSNIGIGNYGALGVMVGVSRAFGGNK